MTRPLRVVLIDDDATDLTLAEEGFSQLESPVMLTGYQGGESAISAMQRSGAAVPDVILLDINMPKMNGFDVLKVLKADARLRLIPVVMLTSSSNTGDIAQAYSLYASSYVIKSASFATFVEQIEGLVQFWLKAQSVTWPEQISPMSHTRL
ncbi:response regulator [Deinococcus alpinitundrae]|uniref:response regulator n=1 Tax=Deinococcus alpinitundrae TaxID=468913 RepID=UPI0013798CE9|nr:response regulator [Deinococcus alpinitundrae]